MRGMTNIRGDKYKFLKTRITGVRASRFCELVINIWNKLSDAVN